MTIGFFGAVNKMDIPVLNKNGLLVNKDLYEKYGLIVYGKPWVELGDGTNKGKEYIGYDYEQSPYPYPTKQNK